MYRSKFSIYDSVLSPGFTDRDATPPDYFRNIGKNNKTNLQEIALINQYMNDTLKLSKEEKRRMKNGKN